MIGIDTNILCRLFVDDGSIERQRTIEFFDARSPRDVVFVSIVVLVEFVWLLSSRYEYTRLQTLDALDFLLANAGFQLEEEGLVMSAVDNARASNSGLADNLVAALGHKAGCEFTMTFDRDAAKRIPGMELLA